jgi:hypothetical protein
MAALLLFVIFVKSSFEFILENSYQLMKFFLKHAYALIFSSIEFVPWLVEEVNQFIFAS